MLAGVLARGRPRSLNLASWFGEPGLISQYRGCWGRSGNGLDNEDSVEGVDRNRTGADGFAVRGKGVLLAYLSGSRGPQVLSGALKKRSCWESFGRVRDGVACCGHDHLNMVGSHEQASAKPRIAGSAKSVTAAMTSPNCSGSRSSSRWRRRHAVHLCWPICP